MEGKDPDKGKSKMKEAAGQPQIASNFKCLWCDEIMPSHVMYIKHILQNHPDNDSSIRSRKRKVLNIDSAMHLEEKSLEQPQEVTNFQCQWCAERISSHRMYIKHIKEKHLPVDPIPPILRLISRKHFQSGPKITESGVKSKNAYTQSELENVGQSKLGDVVGGQTKLLAHEGVEGENVGQSEQENVGRYQACNEVVVAQTKLLAHEGLERENVSKIQSVNAVTVYLQRAETYDKDKPSQDYLAMIQTDVDAQLRATLVDWLAEVGKTYNLGKNTLFSTVASIDRFMSVKYTKREHVWLLGIITMMIISKCEDAKHMTANDVREAYNKLDQEEKVDIEDRMFHMEAEIISVIGKDLGTTTIQGFLKLFLSNLTDYEITDLKLEPMAYYLAKLSLLEYSCLEYVPSLIAAASLFLARITLTPKCHPWTTALQRITSYRPASLRGCVLILHAAQLRKHEPLSVALTVKYEQQTLGCVSQIVPPLEIPNCYFENVLFTEAKVNDAFDDGCAITIQRFQDFLDTALTQISDSDSGYEKFMQQYQVFLDDLKSKGPKKKKGSEDCEARKEDSKSC